MKQKTNETVSTKKLVLVWWNSLTSFQRSYFKDLHFNNRRSLSSLTNKEIEEICKKENVNYQISDTEFVMKDSFKPNQKQFINFSEEHFWKYFNKFKHQDKVKMYELLKSWYSVEGDKTY